MTQPRLTSLTEATASTAIGFVVAHILHARIIRNPWSKDRVRFEFEQARELEAWKRDNRELRRR